MIPNPQIIQSIEQLNYRVTVGDVAAKAGLNINITQQGLLELASNANGHLQVSDTGEIVFLFPPNFQSILRNKFLRLRLQEYWQKIWQILFYLIRISFGILLVASIILMTIAIIIILTANKGDNDNDSDNNNRNSGGGIVFFPRFSYFPDFFWLFDFNDNPQTRIKQNEANKLNFLEAIFSFIFGDGNPNFNLEEKRWNQIGTVITNNHGAVIAEQIAPYLDEVKTEDEDYMLPVLTRFNGFPQVSPEGEIIYYFPDLQVTANQRENQSISSSLQEYLWRFSQADSGQIMLAIGLGALNIILALILGSLLQGDMAAELGGLVAFVDSIYWLLLGYGTSFLGIPLIRYFWLQSQNKKIENRNLEREKRASKLKQLNEKLTQKLNFARQFTQEKIITNQDLSYTTETDLLDQELLNSDKIDQEWQRKLESN
jgi:hypothetical protein